MYLVLHSSFKNEIHMTNGQKKIINGKMTGLA
jgi:hypothetical protein